MDMLISLAINVLLEQVKDKKKVVQFADAFAKVYVRIMRAAESNPTLAGAIQRQIDKG